MMRHRVPQSTLLLALTVSLSVSACDAEDDFDRDFVSLERQDDQAEVSVLEEQPDGIDLVSPMPDPLAATGIWTFNNVVQLSAIADGDVVMLANYANGFVGCDSNDDVEVDRSPLSLAGYVWQVHRTDIDGNGTDEMQFELIDGAGPTGHYLKMDNNGDVYCDTISGVGDAAAWSFGSTLYGTNGGPYSKKLKGLVNYKQDLCLQVSSTSAVGAGCGSTTNKLFRIENLTG